MAQQNTTSTLDGLFKIVYGEGPINLIPDVSYLQKRIPFKEAERIGKHFEFPVVLSSEAGVTYLAAGAGVSTLNSSVAAQMKPVQVDSQQIIVRGQMDYEAAAKAQSSKAAFKNASELLVENLMDTCSKRLELAFLYGRSPTGMGVADTSANASATSTVVTLTLASWADGIWAGLENADINFYKTSDDSLISSSSDAIFTISGIDFANRKLTVTGTATGITALDSHLSSGDAYIHFKNAKSAEPIGLDKIVLNTGSLFGVSASTYSMWSGNSFSAGSAALTVAKILNAVSLCVGRGGLMEEADVLVSPKAFTNLAGSLSDLRNFNDQKDGNGVSGFESIKLFGPNGKLNVIPHPMIKQGEAFIVPFKRVKRIGSQEASFVTPGRKDEVFLHVPDANAYELRLYCSQAIVAEKPAQLCKITNIVNS